MQWDLGFLGMATLLGMSLVFGVLAAILFRGRAPIWAGLIATGAYVLTGIFISEIMFGWATGEDLQPNIDGLSFDEVMIGYFVAVPVLLIVRYVARGWVRRPVAS